MAIAVFEQMPIHASATTMPTEVRRIVLESSDMQRITVDRDVLAMSVTLNTVLIDLGVDADAEADIETIPISNVTAVVLKKVIEWCEHHKGEEYDEGKEKNCHNVSEWDKEYIDVDTDFIVDIILAANFLDIKGLLDLGCKKVTSMMKGKSPEEIRIMFNFLNDLTPEEEEQLRMENWCEE